MEGGVRVLVEVEVGWEHGNWHGSNASVASKLGVALMWLAFLLMSPKTCGRMCRQAAAPVI